MKNFNDSFVAYFSNVNMGNFNWASLAKIVCRKFVAYTAKKSNARVKQNYRTSFHANTAKKKDRFCNNVLKAIGQFDVN